jgi:hypothetical protein
LIKEDKNSIENHWKNIFDSYYSNIFRVYTENKTKEKAEILSQLETIINNYKK